MSLPTTNYVTIQEHRISGNHNKERILPSGSFVRPIEDVYLPDHIKESAEFKWKYETQVFVYCSFGIILIYKNIMRPT